ncbi:zinc finger (c2h2 type) domain-containing protein [Cyclospora cayetanensis]|uniref:Zinc finger (C2h2 type) domain-containing protein n=1 Tax=Cyclospora cayetanensis TaxID=88456 RepID=A0A1D3CWF3_9EIME|nr:zinc finger (c2h2 type) domain-containing protein [Cyclospora cayetanensis]
MDRQILVGIRFRPPARPTVSPHSRFSSHCVAPSDPPRGHSHGEPPRAPQAASCASESTGTSLGEGGITSSSVSSLAGPPEGQGGAVSCRDPRRPPWARRGPTEAEWALKAEDAKGWVLAPPWILDMGAPRVSASDGGTSNEEVRQRVPARVWDGYKDVCYEADYVFGPEASNAEVYFHLVKRLVTAAVGGTNATVLAYGQTASGKTHTMFGSPQQGSPGGKGVPQRVPQTDKGIIQLALQDIFQEREQRGEEERFSVSLAMFEVYQEAVTDLLHGTAGRSPGGPSQAEAPSDLRQKRPIALCEKADGTLDMGSLTTRSVSSLAEALDLVKRGQQRRHAAETAANARSSRSHAVLRVVLAPAAATAIATAAGGTATVAEGTALKEESGRLLSRNPWRPSVLSMVDLAGSEGSGNTTSGGRLTNKTQREGGTINRSLLALSKVVKALTKQQQKQYQHPQKKEETAALPSGLSEEVPGSAGTGQRPPPQFLGLRESKLTRLLGDCLGGPCHTSLICLCAPGAVCYRQTAATLMFARRARKLPPVVQAGVQEGASKLKRHYIKASSSDAAPAPAALAAAPSGLGGSNNCPVEGVPGASSGGPPRPFVYVPTGCVQCRALYKAFQEAKEELACQAIQLRQLRYVINRGLPATAVGAPAKNSSSGRGEGPDGNSTTMIKAKQDNEGDEGPCGAPQGDSHPVQENDIPTNQFLRNNYGGGVCYKPPQKASLEASVGTSDLVLRSFHAGHSGLPVLGARQDSRHNFGVLFRVSPSRAQWCIVEDLRMSSPRECYYSILGIDFSASPEEIKKAYRRSAIERHPDKNPHDPNATYKFQILQEAYECLSDPQERAWYDAHRDKILGASAAEEAPGAEGFGINLFGYFSASCFKGFGDEDGAFYQVYRELFKDIEEAEKQYCQRRGQPIPNEAPSFGSGASSWETTGAFYAYWSAFSSARDFAEADEWGDRRLMERDNQKKRKEAKKEFNETVRRLVQHVRRKDQRVVARQAVLAERRALRKQGYAFADSSSSNCDNGSSDSEADIERQHQEQQPEGRKRTDDEALEAWYATCSVAPSEGPIRLGSLGTTDCAPAAAVVIYVCEVCEKDFRSAQQYEAHARSLKHKKNVKRLAAQLEADLEGLDAGYDELPKPQEAEQQDKEERHDKEEEGTSAVSAEDECEQSSGNQPQATKGPSATGASRISSSRSSSPVSSSSKGRSDLPHISSDESISSCDSGDSDDSCSSDESDSEEDADEALLRLAGSRTAQWGHSKGRRRDSTSSNCSRGELEEPGETVAAVATEESEDEQPDGVEAPKGGRKRHSRRQQLPGKAENNNSKSTSSPKGSRRKQATKVSADCSSSAEAGGATDSGKTTGSKEGIAKETTCAVCGTFFPTRNALFNHIKKEGHAALKPVPVGKGRKTK